MQYTHTFRVAWPVGNSMRYLQHACWQPSSNVQSQITATWSAIYWLLAENFFLLAMMFLSEGWVAEKSPTLGV